VISCLVDTKYLSEERKGLVASILRSSKWDQAMFSILHRKKLDVFVLNQLERLCPEVTVHDSFYLERDIAGKVSEVYSWELDDLFNRLAGLESGAFLIKGEDVVRRILSGENIGISTDIDMLVSPRDRSGNTLAGNVSLQSSSIMVRGLATGEVTYERFFKVLLGEFSTGLLIGLACATIIAFASLFLNRGVVNLSIAVGIALFFSISVAAVMGTVMPLMFHRLGADPAVASGPFVTTLNDMCGLVIYLSVATALLT